MIPAKLYKHIVKSIPIPCVDVIIVHDGLFLLLKRNNPPEKGKWFIPGGRVYKDEKLRTAAQRKAYEETGIHCNVGPLIYNTETIFPDGPFDFPIHTINSCFFLYPKTRSFKVSLDKDHNGFRWCNFIPSDIHPYVKQCLRAAGFDE